MLFYISPSNDPYYNLALEEYLLTHSKEDIMLLYINQASVVVGRFQLAHKELDVTLMDQKDILLARRSSGGGTVFHDPGNLNYAFINNCNDASENYYDRFNKITIDILKHLGYSNLSFQRNNIFCQEKKVSGVAQYKRKKRIVHHGTLLVDADLDLLRQLFTSKPYYISKSVDSISSSVCNLNTIKATTLETAIAAFQHFSTAPFNAPINDSEVENLREKYASKAWILGKSPKYQLKKGQLELFVEQGKISATNQEALSNIVGLWHNYADLKTHLASPESLF